jgi:hypothetical protein
MAFFESAHQFPASQAGLIMERTTGTLLCSDLFADSGTEHPALFDGDILGPSSAFLRKLGVSTLTPKRRES